MVSEIRRAEVVCLRDLRIRQAILVEGVDPGACLVKAI